MATGHNALTRAIRHAEVPDLVKRNVATLVGTPKGRAGRPSKSPTLDQEPPLLRGKAGRAYSLGSVARGADRPDSDLDLLADLPPGLGLLDLGRVQDELEAIVGSRVDLVPAGDLKPGVSARARRDLVAL